MSESTPGPFQGVSEIESEEEKYKWFNRIVTVLGITGSYMLLFIIILLILNPGNILNK